MDWIVKLANGERFIVKDQPDEEEAWAAAEQVRDDHYTDRYGAANIESVEPTD